MAGRLSCRMDNLLYPGPHSHDPSPLRRVQARAAWHDAQDDFVVLPDDPVRGCASARRGCVPPKIPSRPPVWNEERESTFVLSALRMGIAQEGVGLSACLPAAQGRAGGM